MSDGGDFTVIKTETVIDVAGALGRIEAFERECQAGDYTDTGDAWDLIEHVRGVLRDVAHQGNAEHPAGTLICCEDDDCPDRVTTFKDRPGPKIDKVCEVCHGPVSFEGWISWSVPAQAFEVDDICDKGHHCKTCDGQTYAIDVIAKPYKLVIEWPRKERTNHYQFETQRELRAFREGLQATDAAFEIAYTDEELDDGK